MVMLVVYLCVDFDYMIMVIVFAKYSRYSSNPLRVGVCPFVHSTAGL
jgi:hypothetical protein